MDNFNFSFSIHKAKFEVFLFMIQIALKKNKTKKNIEKHIINTENRKQEIEYLHTLGASLYRPFPSSAAWSPSNRHFILYERVLRLRTMLSIFNFIGTIPPIGKDSKVRRLLNSLVDIGLCILVLSQQYLNFFLGYCRCFCL